MTTWKEPKRSWTYFARLLEQKSIGINHARYGPAKRQRLGMGPGGGAPVDPEKQRGKIPRNPGGIPSPP